MHHQWIIHVKLLKLVKNFTHCSSFILLIEPKIVFDLGWIVKEWYTPHGNLYSFIWTCAEIWPLSFYFTLFYFNLFFSLFCNGAMTSLLILRKMALQYTGLLSMSLEKVQDACSLTTMANCLICVFRVVIVAHMLSQ